MAIETKPTGSDQEAKEAAPAAGPRDAAYFPRWLDKAMASLTDPLTVVGRNGETLYQNRASRETLPNPPPRSFAEWGAGFVLHTADGARRLAIEEWPIARALRGEEVIDCELSVLMPNNDATILLATARPLRDEHGVIEGAVLLSRDITEKRRVERELRLAQRMEAVGQLTSGVAHDFNNILMAILSSAELLRADTPAPSRAARLVSNIEAAAERGAALVSQLLSYARKQALQAVDIDANALINETVALLRPTLGEHIRIETNLAPSLAAIVADPAQLSTALLNLAVNARDAMPKGGVLSLVTRASDLGVAIEVHDTGVGIPLNLQERVFEPFFTTKAVGQGSGLGLSMVYGFVRQSGGAIELRSAPGQGTSVVLHLPASPASVPTAHAEAGSTIPRRASGRRILLVEDDPLVRDALCLQLDDLGYRAEAASSGDEALALILSGAHFDLLLTDVIMPGALNGRELAEQALAHDRTLKVVFVSGHPRDVLIRDGRLIAEHALLHKPFRAEELAETLGKMLG